MNKKFIIREIKMAQTLKTEIKDRIDNAALNVFSQKDLQSAKMADIADEAGISVGNIYRYYKNKEDLFYRIVPPQRVSGIKKMLSQRIQAAYGIKDIKKLDHKAQYWKIFEEQLEFMIENRRMLLILLCRSRGTVYENFQNELIDMIKALTGKYLKSVEARVERTPELEYTMDLIYNHLVDVVVTVLSDHEYKEKAGPIIRKFLNYHLAGLKELYGF